MDIKTKKQQSIKLICLCAVACTGKTTYMKSIAGLDDKHLPEYDEDNRPVTLALGQFFRDTLGDKFFLGLQVPCAPAITNDWVKSLMWKSMEIAFLHEKDMIVDGFPRTKEQLKWLLHSSYASTRPVQVEIRFLFANDEMHAARMETRLADCKTEDERKFLEERFKSDRFSFINVMNQAKEMASSDKYPTLTIREIDL